MKRRNREPAKEENVNQRFKSRFLGLLGCVFVLAVAAPGLRADGFIVPNPRPGEVIPPLTVKDHRVTVAIVNQVAKTSVDQVFVNNFDRDIEGTYIFPIPENASVSEFAMFIGGERVSGEILDSRKARRVYEDIVRRMRDPGLLEYLGRGMFQARVYPIPARGEKRIQISYTEVLKSDGNLVKYLYPLNTEKFSRDPLKEFSLSARIESQVPILNVYSPSHRVSVRKEGETKVSIGYEETNVKPDRDFVLYYSLSKDDIGLTFMNWPGPDGSFFMLLASPRFAAAADGVIDKNLILVLDSSGSMRGNKIRQVKAAARYIVRNLGKYDQFSLLDFDDGVTPFSETLIPADREHVDKALSFIDAIEDSGGTNINDALTKGLKLMRPGARPNYILFLTDGQPTVGITETAEILKNIGRANESASRLFVFGVGDDVNTELLDRLASDERGISVYVGEAEDIEAAVSGFYEKVSSPLLADLRLTFKGIDVRSVYPQGLPDLFKGSQLVVVGKYEGDGPLTVVLKGRVGRQERRFVLEGRKLGHDESFNFLPRLWANRRIGYLLEEIRLRGQNPELVEEVRRLGLRYGIVTPYTSFLVTERERRQLPAAAPEAQDAMASRRVTGEGAVKAAKISQAFKAEDMASQVASAQIMYKDDKTFYLKDGVWVDSEYKEGAPVSEIRFNSDEYFRLAAEKPGLVKYLSAGTKLIIVFQGKSYRIVE
jgi:Ca-activated chloride channel family protein